MIKIRKGTSRIVFIFFNLLVVKIPNLRLAIIKRKIRQEKNTIKLLGIILHSAYVHIVYGISANISEGLIYAIVGRKAPHLTPIYTLGVINFSVYEGSTRPTPEEIQAFYDNLSDTSKVMLDKCDSHSKAPGNWRKTKRGLKLIDYGVDPLTAPWALFIFYRNQELNDATNES